MLNLMSLLSFVSSVCVCQHKSEEVTIEKNFKKNINMFEILILKFRLVLFMILHATIAHVQYVSAVVVDIILSMSVPRARRPKGTRTARPSRGVGGDRHTHPRQVLSCHVGTHIIAHVLYSSKYPN